MSIVFISPNHAADIWMAALHGHDPTLEIEVWPAISNPEQVLYALCWNQPAGALRQFPNLKAASSLGAGVNHLLNDRTLPTGLPLVRLVDDNLKQSMAEYVVLGILEQLRQLNKYRQQQTAGKWAPQEALQSAEMGIGIMGYGQLGRYVGDKLSAFGFRVYGWNRRAKPGDAGGIYSGQHQLGKFLQQADILVCLLPLTTKTENILNRQTFAQLPANAYLINVARGAHLVDRDLLAALDSGQLSGALLDVFREEPLPPEHPFWFHKKVSITPHIASVTNPVSAAKQIVENYQRLLRDEPLLNLVDVAAGY